MAILSAFNKESANNLQLDAGIICRNIVNPLKPTAEELKTKCVGATGGGAQFEATPEVTNIFEDLDDAKGKYVGGIEISSIEVKLTFTMKEMTAENFKLAMGAGDIIEDDGNGGNYKHTHIKPRLDIRDYDYTSNVCWYGRKRNGEKVCIVIYNAFNESGLSYSSESNGKGSLEVELQAYFSLDDPNKVPYDIIIFDKDVNLEG